MINSASCRMPLRVLGSVQLGDWPRRRATEEGEEGEEGKISELTFANSPTLSGRETFVCTLVF